MKRPLSPATTEFLRAHAAGPVELDVLLVVLRGADRWWSAADVAAAVGASPDLTARLLDGLAVASLLDIRLGTAVLYRFAPLDDIDSVLREIDTLPRADRDALDRMLGENHD